MTAPVDIVNRAASRIGARAFISDLNSDVSPLGVNARINYTPLRQQLLRAAQWGFARKTLPLTQLAAWTDSATAVPQPWLYKYAYPADCLKMRYLIPPRTAPGIIPNNFVNLGISSYGNVGGGPSRQCRFLVSYDDSQLNGQPTQRVILSNVANAIVVYTVDVIDPELWDSLFENAMVEGLASYLCIPIGGNVKLKSGFEQTAMRAVMEARAADGNEAIPTTDHTPDWIAIRQGQGNFSDDCSFPDIGSYWGGYDNLSWGS